MHSLSPWEHSHWAWALGVHSGKWLTSLPLIDSFCPPSHFHTTLQCFLVKNMARMWGGLEGWAPRRQFTKDPEILPTQMPGGLLTLKMQLLLSLWGTFHLQPCRAHGVLLRKNSEPCDDSLQLRVQQPQNGTHRTREHFSSTSSDLSTVGWGQTEQQMAKVIRESHL